MVKMSRFVFCALLTIAFQWFVISVANASNPNDVPTKDVQTKPGATAGELYKIDFPPPFVNAALIKAKIPQEKVDKINSTLQAKHDYIHQKAKEIGAKHVVRNPFDYPPMEDEIVEIFQKVTFDVYSDVMKSNGINDKKIIEDSYEYIQQQKIKNYVEHQHTDATKGYNQGH